MLSESSTIASELWATLGNELTIFTITLICALVVKVVFPGQEVGKGKGKKGAITKSAGEVLPGRSKSAPFPRAETSPQPKSTVNVSARHIPSQRAGANAVGKRDGVSAISHTPSQIINEVMDGMNEHPNLKFMFRVLTIYGELTAKLAADNLKMPDAARLSKHSAIDFYTTLVQCAVRASKAHLVENIIDDMGQQGVARPLVFYESTMKQLAGQKQYSLALAVYDRLVLDGLQPSAVTCSCLIGFADQAGEYRRAIDFFEKLSSITIPSIRAYMTVLRVHAKRQDWSASLGMLRDMQRRGVMLDSLALNIVLSTGVAADQLDAVGALLAEAENHTPPFSDVVSYNTLIKGHSQRGNVDGALNVMTRMRGRGLSPNAITFNTAMDACVRATRCCDAWKLLADMRVAGYRPDKFTCSILVKSVTHRPGVQMVEDALALLKEVDSSCDANLRGTMYHMVLEAAAQIGDANPGLVPMALHQMRQHGVTPMASAHRVLKDLTKSVCVN